MRANCIFVTLAAAVLIFGAVGCSDSTSSNPTGLNVAVQSATPGAGNLLTDDSIDEVTEIYISRARVVIGRIEFQGDNDTATYRSAEHQPEIVELDLNGNMHMLGYVPIPVGTYDRSLFRMERLEPTDSTAYYQNPDMQGVSLRVEGYVNGDTAESFLFTTELDEEQQHQFAPFTFADGESRTVVLQFNHDSWFRDEGGNLIDPNDAQLSSARSIVETNIVNSFDVYR